MNVAASDELPKTSATRGTWASCGNSKVTRDDQRDSIQSGQAIDIPTGSAHRVENCGQEDLVFIEVQRGDYLGEDDIVRLQDDFGRAPEK